MTPASLPHDLAAEEALIGGLFIDPRKVADVSAEVQPADFFNPVLAAIYQAQVDLDAAGKPIEPATVAERMKAAESYGKLKAKGGESYFAELMTAVVSVENLAYHAGVVTAAATRRRVMEAAGEITVLAQAGEDGWADQAETALLAATAGRASGGYEPARVVAKAVVASMQARYERKAAVTGVPSGFPGLDYLTAGFQPSELTIIAARPSMGKTSLAMNCAAHAALECKIPVLVFSLEMSKEALVERMVSSDAKIDGWRLRSMKDFQPRDWIAAEQSIVRVATAPIWIADAASPTIGQVRSQARRWRQREGVGELAMIMLDYLQLARPDAGSRERNRDREVAEISAGLKALAKELRCPVVALSQLSRACESRPKDKRPTMADLRDSGTIEQDADVIAFIYRDEVYNKASTDKGIAEILLSKQRNGPTGVVRLAWLERFTRFENLAADRDATTADDRRYGS